MRKSWWNTARYTGTKLLIPPSMDFLLSTLLHRTDTYILPKMSEMCTFPQTTFLVRTATRVVYLFSSILPFLPIPARITSQNVQRFWGPLIGIFSLLFLAWNSPFSDHTAIYVIVLCCMEFSLQ